LSGQITNDASSSSRTLDFSNPNGSDGDYTWSTTFLLRERSWTVTPGYPPSVVLLNASEPSFLATEKTVQADGTELVSAEMEEETPAVVETDPSSSTNKEVRND
jgi:hypothetical protein